MFISISLILFTAFPILIALCSFMFMFPLRGILSPTHQQAHQITRILTTMSAVSTHSASVSAFSSRASTPRSVPSSTRPQTPDQPISLAYDYAPETVIIVGSGLAALSAASELIQQQIPVHILERQAHAGGNSIKASSGINGVPTRYQTSIPGPTKEKSDSIATFYADTAKSVGLDLLHTSFFEERDELISTLTTNSAEAVGWLTDDIGVDLSRVARLGGHSFARTHRGAGNLPPGRAIVMALLKQIQDSKLATVETGANVTGVVRRGTDGLVIGVDVEKTEPQQKSSDSDTSQEKITTTTKTTLTGPVIFAAGGFAGDGQGLLHRYRPDLADYPSTNDALPGSARLLRQIGAQLRDMDLVQVHPTGFVDESSQGANRFKPTKFLAAEVLRGEGGILLSTQDGKRFVDELQTRKVVTERIKKLKVRDTQPLRQWDVKLVLDQGSYEAAKSHIDFYLWKGLMRKVSVTELQAELDLATHQDKTTASSTNILRTLQEYASITTGRKTDPLGRTTFGAWTLTNPTPDSPLYVGTVTPVIHYTMGGVAFNAEAEVLDDHGRAITGLWAAGEITGGLHGGNRLGGSSLLECVVFGRIAGRNVARYLRQGQWHAKADRDQRAEHYESPA